MPSIIYIELRDNPGYHYADVLSAINYNFQLVSGGTGGGNTGTTNVQPGTNITTGGTALTPIISVVPSPSFSNLSFSGTGQFATTTSTTFSGGTVSGGTIYSGTTNLSSTIINIANFAATSTGDFTRVRPGSNISTGGTGNSPIISVVASPSFNGLTLSGSAQLTSVTATTFDVNYISRISPNQIIFRETNTLAVHGDITYSTSANLGLFRWYGDARFSSLSATTLSGGTLYSGTTNLYQIFATTGSTPTATSTYVTYGSPTNALTGSTGFTFSAGSATISKQGTNVLTIIGSGSSQPLFTIQGSQGELFSVTDSLSGSLFSVNDISGLPILEVFSDNTMLMGDYIAPALYTTTKTSLSSGTNSIYAIPTSAYTGAFVDYTVLQTGGARAGTLMMIWSGVTANFTDTVTNDIGTTTAVSMSANVVGSYAVLLCSASTTDFVLKTIIRSI